MNNNVFAASGKSLYDNVANIEKIGKVTIVLDMDMVTMQFREFKEKF